MEQNNRPIRVAQVVGKLTAGGVESVVNNYYSNIDKEQYQFDYFYEEGSPVEPSEDMIKMGARFFPIPSYTHISKYIKTLIRLFKENQYDIVHSNMNAMSVFVLYAAKKAGVKIRISHNHSTSYPGDTKRNLIKNMLKPFSKKYATHLAACSEKAGEWLYGKEAMENGSVTVFKNAIDLDKYSFDPQVREEVRKELGVEDKFVVGHVGRFCYQKNHEFLLKIFKCIHDKDANAVLVLVGIGETEEEVRKQAEEMGLTDVVYFLGARNDVERLYQAMDVFVLPSRYEGLPVVGVEAQASGLPCIFSTEITKEVLLTPYSFMLSLFDTDEAWAYLALHTKEMPRGNTTEALRDAGFDIKKEAKKLENYYEGALKDVE